MISFYLELPMLLLDLPRRSYKLTVVRSFVRRGLLASGSLSPLSSTTAMGLFMGPPLLLLLPDAVGDTEGMVVVVVDDDGCGCGGVVVFAVVVVVVVVDAKVEVDVVIGKAVLAGFSRSPASDSGGISQTLVVICRLV